MCWKTAPDSQARKSYWYLLCPGSKPWSLAGRLTVWFAMAVVALVGAAVVTAHLSIHYDSEEDLNALFHKVATRVHAHRDVAIALSSDNEDCFFRVLDPQGVCVHEPAILSREFPVSTFPAIDQQADRTTSDGRPFTLFSQRIEGWTYHFAINRTNDQKFLVILYRNIALVMVPTLAAALLIGYLLTRAGLRPLRQVAAAMKAVSADRLDHRIPAASLPGELARMAETFNETLDRLAGAFSRLDHFAADVAHELRTPIHNLRTGAELALRADRNEEEYRRVLSLVVDEADRVARLIDRLLLLARLSDPRAGLKPEPTDVMAELSAVRDFFEPAATEAGVEISVDTTSCLTHRMDRPLFQRALSNLVANAVSHTPCGGQIALRANSGPAGLIVEVSDSGNGIPSEALPHLFDRYYRPPGVSGPVGTGLGLAIVKRVVELHGGTATVASVPGHGTTVRLTLPEPSEHDMAVISPTHS